MNELKVNFENLTEEERAELLKLVEKANKPKSKVWKPKEGESYFAWCGTVRNYDWDNDCIDNNNYAIGNCFKTEEEAQNAVERLKIRAELQRFADEHNEPIDWEDCITDKWYICYDYLYKIVGCSPIRIVRDCFQIYFTSREVAKAAIQSVGEERIKKYLFGVEE